MPKANEESGPLGAAAQNFQAAIEKLTAAQEEKGERMDELIKALKHAKRYIFQCGGYKFELVHQGPKDTIKVLKPK